MAVETPRSAHSSDQPRLFMKTAGPFALVISFLSIAILHAPAREPIVQQDPATRLAAARPNVLLIFADDIGYV
jgi:hypothetical protein